jgi:hypothetical protein
VNLNQVRAFLLVEPTLSVPELLTCNALTRTASGSIAACHRTHLTVLPGRLHFYIFRHRLPLQWTCGTCTASGSTDRPAPEIAPAAPVPRAAEVNCRHQFYQPVPPVLEALILPARVAGRLPDGGDF